VRLFVLRGIIFLQLFAIFPAGASSQYFDIPTWPGDEESCPTPGHIKNNRGVFVSPAKSQGVDWIGVLPSDGIENVVAFEKAVFVLAEENSETRGFLSSCIYTTSKGRYLSMRLDAGNKPDEVMWIVRLSSWSRSPVFSSKQILECADKSERACAFVLK
jgi:hypothetical protein